MIGHSAGLVKSLGPMLFNGHGMVAFHLLERELPVVDVALQVGLVFIKVWLQFC